jgi:hypothetical protein
MLEFNNRIEEQLLIPRKITRRGVQIALGVLWLLDGALQLQHQMFSSTFATQVIAPAAEGQPRVVSGVMHLAIRIFLLHPAVFNSLIAITQIGLGLLISWKRTARLGLILSIVWGLFVWYVGEGAGGIFSAQTLLLMGAPGAALLYAVLALGVMPRKRQSKDQDQAQQPAYWLALVWSVLWIGGALYQLLPGQNSVSDISSMVAGNASGAPGWLASLDGHVASVINGFGAPATSMAGVHMSTMQMAHMQTQSGSGYWFILLLAFIQLLIGVAIFKPGFIRKTGVIVGMVVSVVFWVVGQSLGAYYTGLATDPSTAPLFILLGVAILACPQLDRKLASLFGRLERIIT